MKYLNLKNGNVIEVSSAIRGQNWQAIEPASSVQKGKVAPVQRKGAAAKKGAGKSKEE